MQNLIERSIWTGVEAGLALLTVESLSVFDVSALQTLAVAGVATVLTALKVLAVNRLAALGSEA